MPRAVCPGTRKTSKLALDKLTLSLGMMVWRQAEETNLWVAYYVLTAAALVQVVSFPPLDGWASEIVSN